MSEASNKQSAAEERPRWRGYGVPQSLAVLGALLTLAAYCGRWGWLWELTTHFRVQYFWLLVIAAALLVLVRAWAWAALACVFATLNLSLIVPLYIAPARPVERGTPLRALSQNVFWYNAQYSQVIRWIRRERPDFFLLLEVTPGWIGALEELENEYPYSRKAPQRASGGIAFYSRIPAASIDFKYVGGMPTIVAFLQPPTGPLTVIGAHPSSPRTAEHFVRRNRELEALTELALFQHGPRVVLGDLNTTSWSPYFQDLIELTGLVDSRLGFGVEPTWPELPLLLRIPIDHCLVSRDVAVTDRRVGPAVGSDHRGVVVDLEIFASEANRSAP